MIIYLDTETTSLYPGQICQLSYIVQNGDKVIGKNFFFSVDYVERGAQMVHGFSKEFLERASNGNEFCHYVNEIQTDIENADYIVGHNISFDIGFLRKEMERCGRIFYAKNEFCTMKNSLPICKLPKKRGCGYKYPKLNEMLNTFGISQTQVANVGSLIFGSSANFHDARFDTIAVYLAVNKAVNLYPEFLPLKEFL